MPILDHFTDIFFFNFIMTHSKYKEKALTPPKKDGLKTNNGIFNKWGELNPHP